MKASAEKWLPWVLGLLFVIGAGGYVALHSSDYAGQPWAEEVGKVLLELGVVSVAGFIVSILTFNYQQQAKGQRARIDRDRAAQENQMNELKATLSRLTSSYNQVKRARRVIRAKGERDAPEGQGVAIPALDACMSDIIDAELAIETIISDIGTSREDYTSADYVLERLNKLEAYLTKIIDQYEDWRPSAGSDDLSHVDAFHGEPGGFEECKTNYKEAREHLRKNIRELRARIEQPPA